MKKLYSFLILVFGLFLTGCGGPKFEDYLNLIEVPTEVIDTLLLPAQVNDKGDHDIYWSSSDESVIKISTSNFETVKGLLYYKTTIHQSEVDIKVTLTLRLEVNGLGDITKDYQIIVIKDDSNIKGDIIDFTFFGINDFHGAVYSKNGGLSKLGNYMISEKKKNPSTTIMIASGDMFQGSAISNMTQGGVVVEAMNEIGFDAMCMGNHEFDWGIDIIKKYNGKTSNPVANFPIICCNIYEKATNKPVDWCEPYTIIERNGIKIGIIGAMGSELESSIAQNRIEPYEFVDVIPLVKKYTQYLRNEQNCEIVVLTIHDNTNGIINTTLANLSGEFQIDAVFDGHTHSTYAGETLGNDNIRMPYLQSGCYGSAIGKIKIYYDRNKKQVVDCSAENIIMNPNISEYNPELDKIIKKYDDITAPIANEVIGISGEQVDKTKGGKWAVNVIQQRSGCQVGFINAGGIRRGAFPINKDEEITVSRVWDIMPFDNLVKTCTLTAKQCVEAFGGYDMLHSSNCNVNYDNKFVIDGRVCEDDELITVAAVDYVFDKPNFPFVKGTNQVNTGELFRDYLINAIREECKEGNKWQCAR